MKMNTTMMVVGALVLIGCGGLEDEPRFPSGNEPEVDGGGTGGSVATGGSSGSGGHVLAEGGVGSLPGRAGTGPVIEGGEDAGGSASGGHTTGGSASGGHSAGGEEPVGGEGGAGPVPPEGWTCLQNVSHCLQVAADCYEEAPWSDCDQIVDLCTEMQQSCDDDG